MPEGDTLHRLARRIAERLTGETCDRCATRDPRLVGIDLTGAVLFGAEAVGKHLFVRFTRDQRQLSLHVHLGMDGEVHVGAVPNVPAWRRRIELGFGATTLTGVDLPVVGLIQTVAESDVIGHLGPDVLEATCDRADIAARMLRRPELPVAGAMLDQRNVAGFGNVFAVEVPFIAGVDPHQPVGTITRLDRLIDLGIALIRWSAAHGVRNTTGRRLHLADHWIYGKRRRPCPQCGTGLRSESDRDSPWGRVTVWCPDCQPLDEQVAVDPERISRLLALHPARRG